MENGTTAFVRDTERVSGHFLMAPYARFVGEQDLSDQEPAMTSSRRNGSNANRASGPGVVFFSRGIPS